MKVRAIPVEVIGWFNFTGELNPVSFRMNIGKEVFKGRILKIQNRFEERLGGNAMEVFTCLVELDGTEKIAEFKYEKDSHRWMLYKI